MSIWDEIAGATVGLITTAATGGNVAAGAAAGTAARNAAQGMQSTAANACPGQPSREGMIRLIESITPAERQRWATAWQSANPTLPFDSMVAQDLTQLARGSLGGSDCKTTSAAGRQLMTIFLELSSKYLSQASASAWTAPAPMPAAAQGVGTGATAAPSAWVAEKGGTGTDVDVRGCVRVGNTLVCGDSNAGARNNTLLYAGGALLIAFLLLRGGK